MKTTPQISQNRHTGFPSMDYNFQATGDPKSSSSNVYPAKKSPPFHRLSSEFFGAEASRHHLVEFSAFTVLGLLTAWPIMSMLIAVTRLAYYVTNGGCRGIGATVLYRFYSWCRLYVGAGALL